jgi:sugar phosphate isomerase/epimerase
MQLGIFGKTFAGTDPSTVFAAVRAAGYDAVQHNWSSSGLASVPEIVPAGTAQAAAHAAHAQHLTMAALSGTVNLIHPDEAVRAANIATLITTIKEAPALGAPVVTLCTGSRNTEDQWSAHPDNETPEAWADFIAAMEELLPVAEASGVKLGVEPELANVVGSSLAARRLIDDMQSDAITIVFDPSNLFEEADLNEQRFLVAHGLGVLAGHIGMAHAKDRTAEGGFTTAGQGVLDYPFFLSKLRETGFDGPLITHGLSADEAPGVAVFLREQLA